MAKPKVIKRRFATYYYSDVNAPEYAHVTQGAASSEKGAVRATVVRVFMQENAKAVIYDRVNGAPIYTILPTKQGVQVFYGLSGSPALRHHHVKPKPSNVVTYDRARELRHLRAAMG